MQPGGGAPGQRAELDRGGGRRCDVLITGDLSYHDAERAERAGLSLIEVPHGDFEWWAFRDGRRPARPSCREGRWSWRCRETWRTPWRRPHERRRHCRGARQPRREIRRQPELERCAPRVRLWIDGGSRGNPGPSAIGVVLEDARGPVLDTVSRAIGVGTNNVAEYRALLAGLEMAERAGRREVEVLSDSELLVKQMRGEYRVKNEGLKPLHEEAERPRPSFRSVLHPPRAPGGERAGRRLVNQALDERLMRRRLERTGRPGLHRGRAGL